MGSGSSAATKDLRDRFAPGGRVEVEDGVRSAEMCGAGAECCSSCFSFCCSSCCLINLWLDRVTLREAGVVELAGALDVMLLAAADEERWSS